MLHLALLTMAEERTYTTISSKWANTRAPEAMKDTGVRFTCCHGKVPCLHGWKYSSSRTAHGRYVCGGRKEWREGEWGRGRLTDVFTKLKGFRKCSHTAVLNHLKVTK